MRELKQPTDKSCLTTCLAMLTDSSVQEVIEFIGHGSPLTADDAILYLAHHGVYLAICVNLGKEGRQINSNTEMSVNISLDQRPALLTVLSERFEGKLHSVIWDGRSVLDPNPLVNGPQEIERYKVTEVWPLLMNSRVSKRMGFRWWSEEDL
jgi:hypothetical protein